MQILIFSGVSIKGHLKVFESEKSDLAIWSQRNRDAYIWMLLKQQLVGLIVAEQKEKGGWN
jgi:hypothetical protein